MIGIGKRKQPLLRALKRSQNKFPAFLINRNLSNALGDLNVPKLLIFNAHGRPVLQIDGHVPEAELTTLLNRSAQLEC
jgi:thioredoxin-related protein